MGLPLVLQPSACQTPLRTLYRDGNGLPISSARPSYVYLIRWSRSRRSASRCCWPTYPRCDRDRRTGVRRHRRAGFLAAFVLVPTRRCRSSPALLGGVAAAVDHGSSPIPAPLEPFLVPMSSSRGPYLLVETTVILGARRARYSLRVLPSRSAMSASHRLSRRRPGPSAANSSQRRSSSARDARVRAAWRHPCVFPIRSDHARTRTPSDPRSASTCGRLRHRSRRARRARLDACAQLSRATVPGSVSSSRRAPPQMRPPA